MKKLIALVLATLMVMSLMAACGAANDTNATTDATPGATDIANPLTTVAPGKLIMATNAAFPPYEYLEGGKIAGIDAEIAAAIAAKLGLELQIDDMEFDSIPPRISLDIAIDRSRQGR